MSKLYVSTNADNRLKKYLIDSGHTITEISPMANIDKAISSHPDIYMCALKSSTYHGNPSCLTYGYPGHAIFNGCCTGKYFIHNLKYTEPNLLKAVRRDGLIEINVSQGYAKCNIVVVDENSIITSDVGIFKAAQKAGLDVLIIEKGQVLLPGYPYGFLGGASGKVGQSIIFNGDITGHSNHSEIKHFIESRGLNLVYFTEYPLTDIGSVIEEK